MNVHFVLYTRTLLLASALFDRLYILFIIWILLILDPEILNFNANVDACASTVNQLRNMSHRRTSNPRKRQRRGPEASTVKVKFYHLPESSRIPKFCKKGGTLPQLLVDHMRNGYGMCFQLCIKYMQENLIQHACIMHVLTLWKV